MNILLINDTMALGGTQTHLLYLSDFLISKNHNVSLIAKKGVMLERLSKKVKYYDRNIEGKNIIKFFAFLPLLNRIIKNENINIIHIHTILIVPVIWMLSRVHKIKIVLTIHKIIKDADWGNNAFLFKLVGWIINTFTDEIITLNETSYNELKPGISSNISIIPNAVNLEQDSSYLYSKLQKGNCFKIGFSGRMISHKNINHLIKIIDQLNKQGSTIKYTLDLIGDGSILNKIQQEVKLKNLSKYVNFIGFTNNIIERIKALDLFIITSKSEGISYSLLEVLSIGKAVIGYNVPGVNQLIVDQVNGRIFEYGDTDAIVEEVVMLSENRKRLADYGKQSYNLVKHNYLMADIGVKIVEIYKK